MYEGLQGFRVISDYIRIVASVFAFLKIKSKGFGNLNLIIKKKNPSFQVLLPSGLSKHNYNVNFKHTS